MRKFLIGLMIFSLIFFCENKIFAHGVGFKESELKSVPLEFFYSTGEKMSYREAKVFSPNDGKFAVQSGRTDENGRFAFIPDTAGEWRVIVRDEEGHQCEAKINITQEFLNDKNHEKNIPESNNDNNLPRGIELFVRAVLGVSIIFNLAMIIKIYRRKI